MAFDSATSILAGLSNVVLEERLTKLQLAYLDLSGGARTVTVSYASGDGAKSVTYDRVDLAYLTQAIRLIQAQLGAPISHPRRPIRVRF